MKDKFIVVDCMGIKQVGFDGAMGVSVLDVEQIVQMMNGFNNTCERLENNIEALSKDKIKLLEHVEVLEHDIGDLKERNNHLTLTLLKYV
jgi:archaellum component FlaC